MRETRYLLILLTTLLFGSGYSQDNTALHIDELEAEVDNLRGLENTLRTILASLRIAASRSEANSAHSPEGYYIKLRGDIVMLIPNDLKITASSTGNQTSYALSSRTDPQKAQELAQQLQKLFRFTSDITFRAGYASSGTPPAKRTETAASPMLLKKREAAKRLTAPTPKMIESPSTDILKKTPPTNAWHIDE